MRIHPHVTLLANDEALLQQAASDLDERCTVNLDRTTGFEDAELIIRDWRDGVCPPDPGVPVITVDLSLVRGRDLLDVVNRVMGVGPVQSG